MENGFDFRPEIHYVKGRAKAVVMPWLCNGCLARSVYAARWIGKYSEWHSDPEHGDWPASEIIDGDKLAEMAENNLHTLPLHSVLGRPKEEVELVAEGRGIRVKHIEHFPKQNYAMN